jgi:hypothetical protein
MNESDAQKVLYRSFIKSKRHVLAVPNCKALYPRGESDLISVTETGLVHEFEIKTSKEDFNRDFRDKSFKHEVLKEGAPIEDKCTPNYFWFAMPRPLCENVEVPEYAGKICVGSSGADVQKKAPRRHSDHITDRARQYLERGATIRFWES